VRLARPLLVLIALAITAWFALSVHQTVDTDRASALMTPHATPAHLARADALLDSAKALNPDRSVDILRAQVELDAHHEARARAILERVVAAEPDNALAWEWLARASVGDLHEFYLAAFRLEQLVPPVPAHH
jgi:predicted Zn-dependent protease